MLIIGTGDDPHGSSVHDAKRHRRELRGWLSYAFASEVFVIVSLTLFLPICLEQFARDNGYLLPDKTMPCIAQSAAPNATMTAPPDENVRCVVKLGWMWIDTASYSLYIYSISVALQALTVISMGGIADHPPHRLPLLLTFALLGSLSATLFLPLPSTSPLWPLSGVFAIFANVGFGASVVAMNAYLPGLARGEPEVVDARLALQRAQDSAAADGADVHGDGSHVSDDYEQPLLSDNAPPSSEVKELKQSCIAALSRSTARLSSFGIALGYGSGIFVLLLALVPVTLLHGSTWALRLAVGVSGIWWALGSILAGWLLPSAKEAAIEEELDFEDVQAHEKERWHMSKEVVKAWKRLGGMLHWTEVRKLKNTFKYLGAWFLLSDGFTTLTSTAILFAKTSLHLPAQSLIIIGVLSPASGILGSLLWPRLQRRLAWSNLKVLVWLVGLVSLVPAYGVLGFLPIFKGAGFGGLTTSGEMFVLAVYFGSVYGAFQGYARALYAELIPPGEEARWYGLFSITDKSSSFLGPLVVGLIADTTGNIRYSFFFLLFMIWSAVPLLAWVDVEQGREDARGYVYGRASER